MSIIHFHWVFGVFHMTGISYKFIEFSFFLQRKIIKCDGYASSPSFLPIILQGQAAIIKLEAPVLFYSRDCSLCQLNVNGRCPIWMVLIVSFLASTLMVMGLPIYVNSVLAREPSMSKILSSIS